MLIVSELSVSYGMHEALSSVSLQVGHDEIVVILGANGAGKSTLLSAIAGINEGEVTGHITLNGEQLLGLDTAQIVETGVAFVPEGRAIFGDLSVMENLQLGSFAEHARHNEDENLDRVCALFPKLAERKAQIVRTMSGGEQQMVAIGRALMSAPSVLMLDEPSLGLSPLLCKELFNSLQQVRDSGVGILLVEQNAKQSLSISDRGYLLGNGKIVGQDSARSLANDPTVQAAYLGGAIADRTQPSLSTPNESTPAISATERTATEFGDSTPNSVPLFSISPDKSGLASERLSSNSLIGENLDDLVSRASSTALQHRTQRGQIAKYTNSVPGQHETPRGANEMHGSRESPISTASVSQNDKVQKLLAEFETAALNAASQSTHRSEPADHSRVQHSVVNDLDDLPHIPVYKKTSVTVYRRDATGKLRKQESR